MLGPELPPPCDPGVQIVGRPQDYAKRATLKRIDSLIAHVNRGPKSSGNANLLIYEEDAASKYRAMSAACSTSVAPVPGARLMTRGRACVAVVEMTNSRGHGARVWIRESMLSDLSTLFNTNGAVFLRYATICQHRLPLSIYMHVPANPDTYICACLNCFFVVYLHRAYTRTWCHQDTNGADPRGCWTCRDYWRTGRKTHAVPLA